MMEQNLFIRRAAVTDAELLAETRRSAWDATYRGIYPDAWIDEYDLAEQTQRERARLEQTDYMAYLVMDGGQCAGYFSYGVASHGGYKDFSFCLNSLYLLPPYQHMGLGRRIFAQVRQAARERKLDSFSAAAMYIICPHGAFMKNGRRGRRN